MPLVVSSPTGDGAVFLDTTSVEMTSTNRGEGTGFWCGLCFRIVTPADRFTFGGDGTKMVSTARYAGESLTCRGRSQFVPPTIDRSVRGDSTGRFQGGCECREPSLCEGLVVGAGATPAVGLASGSQRTSVFTTQGNLYRGGITNGHRFTPACGPPFPVGTACELRARGHRGPDGELEIVYRG